MSSKQMGPKNEAWASPGSIPEEDWRRKRGSGSQLELLLHNSHAPSIVVLVMYTYHHSLSPPPLPCLMLIFLGGGEQLQDGDEVECLRFISQRSLI
ncbi:hypothetical protein AMTRI_Chr10g226070 [Amborella trichopoda]